MGGSIRTPSDRVIRSENDFRALWGEHYQSVSPIPPLPVIDFSQEMVLASYLGERPTGGYGIEIIRLLETDTELNVEVHSGAPLPGAVVTQALTYPGHMIRTRRSDKPVIFNRTAM